VTTRRKGAFGYHTRTALLEDLDALKQQRGPMMDKLAGASLAEIVADPQLLDFARAQGRVAFADNCAPCHGAGGGGAKGYPNLNDDDWLWGGKLRDIEQTSASVRVPATTRPGRQHAAFGRDNILSPTKSRRLRILSFALGLSTEPGRISALAKKSTPTIARSVTVRREGQPRDGRSQPDRQIWIVRRRQGHDRAGDRERPGA
jgi:cytochrome c oxidase cbb3-type subunit 3